jgi:hypothetical protein
MAYFYGSSKNTKAVIIIKNKDNKKMGRGWSNQKRFEKKLKKRNRGKNQLKKRK